MVDPLLSQWLSGMASNKDLASAPVNVTSRHSVVGESASGASQVLHLVISQIRSAIFKTQFLKQSRQHAVSRAPFTWRLSCLSL